LGFGVRVRVRVRGTLRKLASFAPMRQPGWNSFWNSFCLLGLGLGLGG